ncbi:porphobilinogen synthase [Desulfovibrio sp. OttesenSCG-928-G11]|nr:porphobilinogen synthase [Desulfovibrio sp. OttesenSCG-928-G11]
MFYRGRRLRGAPALREMLRETRLAPADLSMLYFVEETGDAHYKQPIAAMPGQYRHSVEQLLKSVAEDVAAGLRSCMIFGIPARKDARGSSAYADDGIVQQALRRLRELFPDLYLITDVCLCEYTDHGHCGLLGKHGEVQNDPTLDILARTAVSHARAGADMVAPSDMMDGRVAAIRAALDESGFSQTPLLSYAVKYASAFYGPFREAAGSTPQAGDRKGYQMDPGNRREAFLEAAADLKEGADMLMVKPAGPCLDIIRQVRDRFDAPLAAYQVSGEYAMIKSAAELGRIDGPALTMESLLGIRRAGADLIFSYFTSEILRQGYLS